VVLGGGGAWKVVAMARQLGGLLCCAAGEREQGEGREMEQGE
jgi:hypothetical protein